jgi:hypothetical protein
MTNIAVELHEVDDKGHESLRLLHTLPKKPKPRQWSALFGSGGLQKSQIGPRTSQKIPDHHPEMLRILYSLAEGRDPEQHPTFYHRPLFFN